MIDKKICLYNNVIEIAEYKNYLELVSRICYYNDNNANGVILPFDENSKALAETLVNMPVQAKYRTNSDGEPTFGSHEMYKDNKGNITFNTSSIGVHTEVWIEESEIQTVNNEIKTLPCLYARYRIWKRYENVVAAVQRLFSLNKLYSSWEISVSEYEFKGGIKILKDYVFEANTLLGYEYAMPSYGTSATAVSIAEQEDECMIAEALSKDLIGFEKERNEKNMNDENEKIISEKVTVWDILNKIERACREKFDGWFYVAYYFPEDKEIWVKSERTKNDLDYIRFTYSIDESDNVVLSEGVKVTLTVSPKEINNLIAEYENKIAEKDKVLAEKDAIISEQESTLNDKNTALTSASIEAASLKEEIEQLKPYKEQAEAAENKKREAELVKQKSELTAEIVSSGFITEKEISESEELKGYVENLDRKSLNAIVGERYAASLKDKKETAAKKDIDSTVEVGSVNLSNSTDVDAKSIMKNYFNFRL